MTKPQQIVTHEYRGDPKKRDGRNHWVTCISGRGTKIAVVAGPYPTHAEAEEMVDRAQYLAEHKFSYTTDLAFAAWGTGSSKKSAAITPKLSAAELAQ